jgi:hypothetical protein
MIALRMQAGRETKAEKGRFAYGGPLTAGELTRATATASAQVGMGGST